jgi:hypothetical protein
MKTVCAYLIIACLLSLPDRTFAANIDSLNSSSAAKISVAGCITWWSHDAMGYHPMILLKLENTSVTNLTGELLRFQGRFTDVRTGYVSVARKELRQDFASHHQIYLALKAPTAVDLPIDDNAWPSIECKVMCRIGAGGDETTQNLIITHLDSITMSDDEAFAQFSKQISFSKTSSTTSSTKAMPAIPLSGRSPSSAFTVPASLPGMGDDFYLFEKAFGQPSNSDIAVTKDDLTWARYRNSDTFSEVIVGSRSTSGKADIIIVLLPPVVAATDQDLLSMATALLGKARKASLTPFVHTVKYLQSGRSEINHASAGDCQIVSFKLPSASKEPGQTVLAVSRLPADLEKTLASYAKRVTQLQVLRPGLPLNYD